MSIKTKLDELYSEVRALKERVQELEILVKVEQQPSPESLNILMSAPAIPERMRCKCDTPQIHCAEPSVKVEDSALTFALDPVQVVSGRCGCLKCQTVWHYSTVSTHTVWSQVPTKRCQNEIR